MAEGEKRATRRFKIALKALVTPIDGQTPPISCMIRDASLSGCQIISASVHDLPEDIYVKVPDLDQSLAGRIVWRKDNTAGVEFQWQASEGDERRGARRIAVEMPAVIYNRALKQVGELVICDASSTGCRVRGANVIDLPEETCVSIPSLTEPLPARIVWRSGYQAGLQFDWEAAGSGADNS